MTYQQACCQKYRTYAHIATKQKQKELFINKQKKDPTVLEEYVRGRVSSHIFKRTGTHVNDRK